MKVAGIIVASGSGSRMKTKIPKQFLRLCGKKVLDWSIEAFIKAGCFDEIIVVLPAKYSAQYTPPRYSSRTNLRFITGGRRRVDSVKKGLRSVSLNCRMVAIHDGVRPLILPKDIRECITAAKKFGASIAAAPCIDTIKSSGKKGLVATTLDRSKLWLVQTPQVFKKSILDRVFSKTLPDVTDDSQLVEKAGNKVRIVPVGSYNRKITHKEDLLFAESILKARLKRGVKL